MVRKHPGAAQGRLEDATPEWAGPEVAYVRSGPISFGGVVGASGSSARSRLRRAYRSGSEVATDPRAASTSSRPGTGGPAGASGSSLIRLAHQSTADRTIAIGSVG